MQNKRYGIFKQGLYIDLLKLHNYNETDQKDAGFVD